MLLALALALTVPVSQAPTVEVAVFDQPVAVSLALPGFQPAEEGKTPRTLLFGQLEGGATFSLLCEDNDPFVSGAECASRWKGAASFSVGDVPCVETSEKLPARGYTLTRYHAYVATPDYLYDLHASTAAKDVAFGRKDFAAIVKSFAVQGRPRPEDRRFPDEYYALRDEAATHPKDQLAWIRGSLKSRADDPLMHFYGARVFQQQEKDDLAADEFVQAADRLAAMTERSEKHTTVLLEALDTAAALRAGKKAWREAITLCERIVQHTEAADSERAKEFRTSALYHLAIAHAQSRNADQAFAFLGRALELDPALRERAAEEPLLEPLRRDARFAQLTKG